MKDLKTILESKPRVKDYDYQPYGYINALQNYVSRLEEAINYSRCCMGEAEQLKPKQQICYKSNEPCKYDCSGLCKESY